MPTIIPKITANFLPKFDNQRANKRLCSSLEGRTVDDLYLFVSKKHSGSLVFGPPFYSKNSTANKFTRVATFLLYQHFVSVSDSTNEEQEASVEPSRSEDILTRRTLAADNLFSDWWISSKENNICCCFELVVPKILGDHGSRPKAAYLVLTAASKTDEERFLSPFELVTLATRFRLPLNESWIFPSVIANEVEETLNKVRWRYEDSEVSQLLNSFEGSHRLQFLKHSDTQGEVIEGFVLMLLKTKDDSFKDAIEEYNALMSPFKANALKMGLSIGSYFSDVNVGSAFFNSILDKQCVPFSHLDLCKEPQLLKDSNGWDLLTNLKDTRVARTLLKLKQDYQKKSKLKVYNFNGLTQLQVHVFRDELFFAWPSFQNEENLSPLFRGLVVTLLPESTDDTAKPVKSTISFNQTQSCEILAISKLKFLTYIWRTFGVRNKLMILKANGKERYIKSIQRSFLLQWEIPQVIHPILLKFFNKVADYVLKTPSKQINENSYLHILEDKFLVETPFPINEIKICLTTSPDEKPVSDELNSSPKSTKIIVSVPALPPGGGKSSVFECLKHAFSSETSGEILYQTVSSDLSKNKSAFEKKLLEALQKGNEEKISVIGYDKNMPNRQALEVLQKAVSPVAGLFNIFFVFIVPSRLAESLFWNRVKARSSSHVGLAISQKLSEEKCYRIFKNSFFRSSLGSLDFYQSLPNCRISNCFLKDDPSLMGVKKVVSSVFDDITRANKFSGDDHIKFLSTISVAYEDLFEAFGASMSPLISQVSDVRWISLYISKLEHVTLLPPILSCGQDQFHEWEKVCSFFWDHLQGKTFTVSCKTYVIAYPNDHVGEAEYKVCFWIVDEIMNLPIAAQFKEQYRVLHITDLANLGSSAKPVQSKEVLEEIVQRGSGIPKYKVSVEKLSTVRRVEGSVRFNQY